MILKRIYYLLSIFIPLLFCTLSAIAENVQGSKNNYVLILSSYNYENEWGTAISKSIRREIEKKNSDVLVNITYADITRKKSFLGGRLGMQAAFANARLSATRILPAVLVLIGDEAWMYYRIMNLRGLWESIPVVLVGVNAEILDDYSKFFSGKVISPEDFIPLQETFASFHIKTLLRDSSESRTIDLIIKTLPCTDEIYFIAEKRNYQDYFLSGKITSYIEKVYPEIQFRVLMRTSDNMDSIYTFLQSVPENTVVLVNSYQIGEEVSAPVYSLQETSLNGKSMIGGYYPDSDNYGSQASDIILSVFENNTTSVPDINIVEAASPHLNKEAMNVWNIKTNISGMPGIVLENIPPSFFEKYRRILLVSFLIILVLAIVIILAERGRQYRKSLKKTIDRYKKLYEEYQIVYENIPMGLVQLDAAGNVYEYNPIAGTFLEAMTGTSVESFNICSSDFFDDTFYSKIKKKQTVDEFHAFKNCTYRIIIKYLEDLPGRRNNILMILIDITEIELEKRLKEEIYSIFNFAINASSLGLAEYNLLDGNGFATDAWYKNWRAEKSNSLLNLCSKVIPEDKEKIHEYLKGIKEGKEGVFLDTICLNGEGEKHWLRYIMKPMEYAPDKGRVIVAGLVMNIDQQKKHEADLAEAIAHASESDRMKNSFIANMSNEIRPCLDELIASSTEMTQTTNKSRKAELLELIEKNNGVLLNYIRDIIHLSQSENLKDL